VILPLVGVWALVRELQFGRNSERLVRLLDEQGALPVEELPIRASGRPVRASADDDFPRYKAEVDAAPEDWRAWFRLGLATTRLATDGVRAAPSEPPSRLSAPPRSPPPDLPLLSRPPLLAEGSQNVLPGTPEGHFATPQRMGGPG
jgi:hypothetical protein